MERQHARRTAEFLTRDHYATLGVPRNADGARIRDAYRALARRHHPDLHPGDRDAEEALKRINEAYEVLSDFDKRRKYDHLGEEWEGIVREEEHLRRAAGFAPARAEQSASWERRTAGADVGASALFDVVRSAPILVLTLMMVGIAMMASRAPHFRTRNAGDEADAIRRLERARPHMRSLSHALAELTPDARDGCRPFDTVAANDAAMQIDRAEADGLFALPLAAADQRVLGALRALHATLDRAATGDVPDCGTDGSRELARMIGAAERCLSRLSTADVRMGRAQARAGHGVCR